MLLRSGMAFVQHLAPSSVTGQRVIRVLPVDEQLL